MKNALLALLEKGVSMLLAFGTVIVLLRSLSKEDFAAWGLFLITTYMLEMGRSGLIQNGLVRRLALSRADANVGTAIRRAAFALNFLYTLCSNLLLWLLADWIMRTWQAPQLSAVFPVYFATNFVLAWMAHQQFVQQAHHEFRGLLCSSILYRGALFAWVLYASLAGEGPTLVSMAWAMCAGACAGALGARLFTPKASVETVSMWQLAVWLKHLIGYGKWVLGTNLSTMLYKNADKLVLGYLLGPAAFAVYDAAGKMTQLVEAPAFSVAAVAFPKSAERQAEGGAPAQKDLYERSVGAVLALILPPLLAVFCLAEPLMCLFAGPGYIESADILRITVFFGVFLPYAVQFGVLLDASGKPSVNFLFTVLTAACNLLLSFVAIRAFGLAGAAYATLCGYILGFLAMQRYLYNHFRINAFRAWMYVPVFYRMLWQRFIRGIKA